MAAFDELNKILLDNTKGVDRPKVMMIPASLWSQAKKQMKANKYPTQAAVITYCGVQFIAGDLTKVID